MGWPVEEMVTGREGWSDSTPMWAGQSALIKHPVKFDHDLPPRSLSILLKMPHPVVSRPPNQTKTPTRQGAEVQC